MAAEGLDDIVWVCVRRVTPTEYHLQGIGRAEEGCSAEQMAVAMCRDEHYFIFPQRVNVSLPEKPIEAVGGYWPHAKDKGTIPADAPSITALRRAERVIPSCPDPLARAAVHYRARGRKETACRAEGRWPSAQITSSRSTRLTTCGNCKRTRAYRAASLGRPIGKRAIRKRD